MATDGVRFDRQLHDELMAMIRRDRASRTGGIDNEGDDAREITCTEYGAKVTTRLLPGGDGPLL